MLKKLIFVTVIGLVVWLSSKRSRVILYGSFNYSLSNDENSSGKNYSKLEDNGSSIGVEVIDLIEGDRLQVLHYLKLVLTLTIVDQILLILNLHM